MNGIAKRVMDFTLALMALILFSPIIIFFAVLIVIDSKGPMFFMQKRVGQRGSLFSLIKLRSMSCAPEGTVSELTVGVDRRITRVGKFIRSTKIDELPQLVNILRGEMSFVGPRPEVPKYVNMYTEEQRKVLDFLPGLTDPASIKYANESELLGQQRDAESFYLTVIMPDKIRINLSYAKDANLVSDVIVIFRTILCLFR